MDGKRSQERTEVLVAEPADDLSNGHPEVLDIVLPRDGIDADAYDAVVRLQREGFTTYLVGGGVRDLLLGRQPKDFDISTAAEPRTVRRLFRNAQLIGRRFQIVHLRYGTRILEVSCFRKREAPADGGMRAPLACENNYGSPREDAFARDFTVNALFYDPVREVVIDHVGGFRDLKAGVLRTVGAPTTWFYEDPVRILRAAKFAGRLGFGLPPAERDAMRERASLLHICPPSRVTEELFRILESGASAGSYRTLWETGVLAELLPELHAFVEDDPTKADGGGELFRMLTLVDRLVVAHGGLPRDFLFAALFYPPLRRRVLAAAGGAPADGRLWGAEADEFLHERTLKLHIPRSYRARQRMLVSMTGNVLAGGTGRRLGRVLRQAVFPDMMALLRLHHRLYDDVAAVYDVLRAKARAAGLPVVPPTRPEMARLAPELGAARAAPDERRGDHGRRRGHHRPSRGGDGRPR